MPVTTPEAAVHRIPVCLLTGFLGAGKTTLLNQLTRHPDMTGTALLINEFGEIGIDHHLVEAVADDMMILDSGCLCCSVKGDFIQALKSLHDRLSRREIPPIRRVIVETTGLADPAPVVHTLMTETYVSARYFCDGVLTVVDASLASGQFDRHAEARRQVVMADRLLISKSDLTDRSGREALSAKLDALNPAAPRVMVSHGAVSPDALFGGGLYADADRRADVAAWLGGANRHDHRDHDHPEHDHDCAAHGCHGHGGDGHDYAHGAHSGRVESFTVCLDRPVPWRAFSVAMGRILADHGHKLLRIKGLVAVAGGTTPVAVQCVQGIAYPPVRLPSWPREGALSDRRGRLVFIMDHPDAADITEIRNRLNDLPSDAAAIRALATNPLLPTRCWLAERMPVMNPGGFETDGWVIQPQRYRGRRAAS